MYDYLSLYILIYYFFNDYIKIITIGNGCFFEYIEKMLYLCSRKKIKNNKIMGIQFYGTREINVFRVELGVLLPPTHKDYNSYNQVYGGKNAYYDENNVLFITKEDAIAYAKQYVNNGVVNTYAIVVDEIIHSDIEGLEEIERVGWNDSIDMDEFTFDGTNVVFSLVGTEDKEIENFIDKTILK